MNVVEQDIEVARGMAAEMFADETFVELYQSAETEEERAARVIFYVLAQLHQSEP